MVLVDLINFIDFFLTVYPFVWSREKIQKNGKSEGLSKKKDFIKLNLLQNFV